MASALDNRVSDEARRWVDSLETKWRLQVMSKKYRLNAKGEKVALPMRIRRFVEGIPHALVDEAIKYLLSLAPYRGIIYNGVPIEGEYRPTLTQWTRDNQDNIHTTGKGQNDGTYTLVQDLIERTLWDTYGVGSELSCSSETLTEYVWDAPSVEELPATGDLQGVTYAIAGVQRAEDGTFSYSVVKRTAKTQHIPAHVTHTDKMSETTVEAWKSVYGSPDEGWRDDAGTPLAIPAASQETGKLVDVQYSLQPDCTYDVSVQTVTAKPVKVTRTTKKTLFSHDESDGYYGQASALSDAPKAKGGKVEDRTSQLQPDGTYHTNNAVTVEQDVRNQQVRVVHGRRGYLKTVTDYGQPTAPSVTNLSLGSSVEYQRTPGNLYNVTRTSRTYVAHVGAVSCDKTIFEHNHSETRGAASLFRGHVADAAGGVIHSVNSAIDDEGFITDTESTKTELPVSESKVDVIVTPFGSVTTRTDTNQKAAAKTSGLSVGESVTVVKTPGGLYNNTVSKFTARPQKSGESCSKDIFSHKHGTTTSVSSFSGGHVAEAGGGKTYSRSESVQSDGSIVQQESTETELAVNPSGVGATRSAHAIRTTTNYTNAVSPRVVGLGTPGNAYQYQKTPGGRYSGSVTETTVAPQSTDTNCSTTVFQHQHSETRYSASPGQTEAGSAGGGKTYAVSVRMEQDGFYANTSQTTTEIEGEQAKSYSSDRFTDTTTEETANRGSGPQPVSFSEGMLTSESGRRTPGGRWDVSTQTTTAKAADWDYEVDTNWHYSYTIAFRNQKADFVKTAIQKCKTKLSKWCVNDTMAERLPSHYSISPSDQLNNFGLHDGSVTLAVNWSMDSAGKDGTLMCTLTEFEWQTHTVSANINHTASLTKDGYKRYAVVDRTIDVAEHRAVFGRGESWVEQLFSQYKNNAKPFGVLRADVSFNVITKTFSISFVSRGERTKDQLVYDETSSYNNVSSAKKVGKAPEDGGSLN